MGPQHKEALTALKLLYDEAVRVRSRSKARQIAARVLYCAGVAICREDRQMIESADRRIIVREGDHPEIDN